MTNERLEELRRIAGMAANHLIINELLSEIARLRRISHIAVDALETISRDNCIKRGKCAEIIERINP